MEDWFKWLIGMVVAAVSSILGWTIITMLNGHRKIAELHADLKTRFAVLEARPHVDPIHNTKLLTEITATLATMQLRVSQASDARADMYSHLKAQNEELLEMIKELKRDNEALRKELSSGLAHIHRAISSPPSPSRSM